jgi:hypothetical protein
MFGCLLVSGSFDNPKGTLDHKQTSLPITFGGVGLILTFTIAPTTYLGNWALVALIIVVRFMVDQHPFLLEALTWINNNTFSFQQDLNAACDLLPPPTCACLPPFEQLIGQQIVQFQDSISETLHHHTFSSMFPNGISKVHQAQILSCFSPRANDLFTTQPVLLAFRLFFPFFSTTLRTWLGLPNPSIVSIPQCVCTHPIDLMGINLLCCVHGNDHTGTHDAIHNTFPTIV